MIIEDHGARDGGQKPPDGRPGPGQPVDLGVLLVVAQLRIQLGADAAVVPDDLTHLTTRQVGVHLVAQERDEIRYGLLSPVREVQGERQ